MNSCSSLIQKQAVSVTAGIAQKGQGEIKKLSTWTDISTGLPAQIVFAETMLASSPEDLGLLGQLIQGNTAAGFLISETQYLEATSEKDQKNTLSEAKKYYVKTLEHFASYLKVKGSSFDELLSGSGNAELIRKTLSNKFSNSDYPTIFYAAQAWASLINLSRQDINLVSNLHVPKTMIDFVCEKNPQFEEGLCQIFQALYEWGRPKMLGGDHKLAFNIYQTLEKTYPSNLLYPVLAAQFALLPNGKSEDWDALKNKLKNSFSEFNKSLEQPGYLKLGLKDEFYQHPQFNIFNVVAQKRFESLIKKEKELLVQ